jgi:Flp pilus assembly protein TadB
MTHDPVTRPHAMGTGTVSRADRRRFVSPWFKHRMAARFVFAGLVVAGAVCLAFGTVGVVIGAVVLAAAGVGIYVRRTRRLRSKPLMDH